jgi:hypothetical protein
VKVLSSAGITGVKGRFVTPAGEGIGRRDRARGQRRRDATADHRPTPPETSSWSGSREARTRCASTRRRRIRSIRSGPIRSRSSPTASR